MQYVKPNDRQIQIIEYILQKFEDCKSYVTQPVLILTFENIIQSIHDQTLVLSFVQDEYHAIPLQYHLKPITAVHPKTGQTIQGVFPTLVVFQNISLIFQNDELNAYISFAECAYKHFTIEKLFNGIIDSDEYFAGFVCMMSEITYYYFQKHPEIEPSVEQAQSIAFHQQFTEKQNYVDSLNNVFYNS